MAVYQLPESDPGRQKLERALADLQAKHQAIIDAWFAQWLEQERARIEAIPGLGQEVTDQT